jgi:hypothetical protein
MAIPKVVLQVLEMTEEQMMAVDVLTLYQAFYALPTHYPLVNCDPVSGRGFERLNEVERVIAERIVRVIHRRCPAPKVERWKNFKKAPANDPVIPSIRLYQ